MFTGTEDHEITLQEGIALTHRFQTLMPGGVKALYYSKASLELLLDQQDCVGARVYFGLSSDLKFTAVLVGVKADETDITAGVIVDTGTACPPNCVASALIKT